MKPSPADQPGEFTGRHMLMIMVSFFGVVIIANVTLAVNASRSWTGLVVENSYASSQTFDKDTAAIQTDALKDIHPQIQLAKGLLSVKINKLNGDPVPVTNAKLTVGRAVSATTDRTFPLTNVGPGAWSAPAELAAGNWAALLVAQLPDGAVWSRRMKLHVE